jgi:hypothetical protein
MRFVSRVRFRRLGCEITEVCEITWGGVIAEAVKSHPPGLKSQPPVKSRPEITAPCEITWGCEITRAACDFTGGVKSHLGVNS